MKISEYAVIKKGIVIFISVFLFFMFFMYSGVLRDDADPIAVARYYWVCIGNREGFLTYHMSDPAFFNEDKLGKLYTKFRLDVIEKMEYKLLEKDNAYSGVKVTMVYRDRTSASITMDFEKAENVWLIKGMR